jgi:hypothetical protein
MDLLISSFFRVLAYINNPQSKNQKFTNLNVRLHSILEHYIWWPP